MKNLEQQFSEDHLSITQSSNSVRDYINLIPVDLLIDIFSRVPAKSIARFRCVSKLWESILGRPDFTELFLTVAILRRPRLLFAFAINKESFVFSAPQPQNLDENSSLSLVATPYKYFPKYFPTGIPKVRASLRGLLFLQNWRRRKVQVICNPLTGESITLPKLKAADVKKSYFGFDPISKQFKVLCMTWSPDTHQILTLETGKRLWRTIQDDPNVLPHISIGDGICIHGVLYYEAFFKESRSYKIICFDFKIEKFSFIKLDKDMVLGKQLTLFNYKGKLGAHQDIGWRTGKFALWVLEDAGKHRWSKRICVLPPLWDNIVNTHMMVGMTVTGEIVYNAGYLSYPFDIFFYNIERNTVTRLNIQGFEEFKPHFTFAHTFLDYVEFDGLCNS